MYGKKKYLETLTVISFVSILVVTGFVDDSSAASEASRTIHQFAPISGIICGDMLCSETGGKILMPWEKINSETIQPDCNISNSLETCVEITDIPIEEKTTSDTDLEIDALENSLEANATSNFEMPLAKANVPVSTYDFDIPFPEAHVPVTIPLHQGYYVGKAVYYIVTDSSDSDVADIITKNQGWKVNLSSLLANATEDALSKTYMFTNGVPGDGVYGFQGEIFTNTPEHVDAYSALTSSVQVTWNDGITPIILDSEKEMLLREKLGKLVLSQQDIVLNMPQIVWPESQMLVKANKTITNQTTFVGGQVIDVDLANMTTTFIAHQGWNPDGKIIYFIVTDATPIGPANSLGVTYVPKNAALITNPAAIDMFHFMNGIEGPGPLGFQAGISSSSPGDANYSPMSRIYFIGWSDPDSTSIIHTTNEINTLEESGLIRVDLARPMNADHIVNSPIIDPIQLGQMK